MNKASMKCKIGDVDLEVALDIAFVFKTFAELGLLRAKPVT